MEDYLLLEMPAFKPHYKKWKKYGYKNVTEKNNLKDTLEESTGGFCMYCYARIRVDKKLYADLEHAIEKSNLDKLIECIPNIGLACSVCNQSFKRIGEKKRKIEKNTIRQFEKTSRCSAECRKQCTVACKALRELQKEYSAGPDAEILLQPMGIRGSDSKEMLALQYNVMKMEYEPAENRHTYSDRELRFIKAHIKSRFSAAAYKLSHNISACQKRFGRKIGRIVGFGVKRTAYGANTVRAKFPHTAHT